MLIFNVSCKSENLESEHKNIEKASIEMSSVLEDFNSNLYKRNLDVSIKLLLKDTGNIYKKFICANMMYKIDKNISYNLHKELYEKNKNCAEFIYEFAIELHRKNEYAKALELYEKYEKFDSKNINLFVYMSDCYINTNQNKKSKEYWTKANYKSKHTSIDFAIGEIYGYNDNLLKRERYRHEIENKNFNYLDSLVYLDLNWEFDWWNGSINQEALDVDINLLELAISNRYDQKSIKQLSDYIKIKQLYINNNTDSLKTLFENADLIYNNHAFPQNDKITEELFKILFNSGLMDKPKYYQMKGYEILKMSKEKQSIELLNIYAHLQVQATGSVDEKIDLMGWKELNDARFAGSYFAGKASNLKYDDKELNHAIEQFKNSSSIYMYKTICARNENKNFNFHLAELIKREFRSLEMSPRRYADLLNNMFNDLDAN